MSRLSRRLLSSRGDGKLGLIIAIAVAATVVYLLVKLVPPRVDNASFQDYVLTRTRESLVGQESQEKLIDSLQAEAAKAGLIIKEEDIRIMDSEREIKVSITYDRPIPLIGKKDYVKRFNIDVAVPKL